MLCEDEEIADDEPLLKKFVPKASGLPVIRGVDITVISEIFHDRIFSSQQNLHPHGFCIEVMSSNNPCELLPLC